MTAINQYGTRVSAFLREVVLRRAAVITAVTAVTHLIVVYGLLSSTAGPVIVDRVGQTIDALGIVLALFAIRAGVTPADPKLAPASSDGKPLMVSELP